MKKILISAMALFFAISGIAYAVEYTPQDVPNLQNLINKPSSGSSAGYASDGAKTTASSMIKGRSTSESSSIRNSAQQRMAELRKQAQAAKDQAKERRILARELALSKFDQIIISVESSKSKILGVLPKLEYLGISTVSAKEKLNQAQNMLDEAKSKLADASQLLSTSSGELSSDTKEQLRTLAKDAQTLIKNAHLDLIKTIQDLKLALKNKKAEIENTGSGGGGYNGATDGNGQVAICDYPAPSRGCTYVRGPNYNSTNQCGMVLSCEADDSSMNEPVAACSYAPAPTGCTYVPGPEYDNQTSCGMILSCPVQ